MTDLNQTGNSGSKPSTTKIFIFVFCLLTLLFSLFLALPTVASSNWAKEKIENYAKNKINGSISFESLNFSFWGTQEIKGVQLKDLDGKLILKMSTATIEATFLTIIFQGILENPVTFSGVSMNVEEFADGTSNIQKIFKASDVSPIESERVNDLSKLIILKNVSGNLNLSSTDPLIIKINGLTTQGQMDGSFDLDISLSGIDSRKLLDIANEPDMLFIDSASFNVNINASNFPMGLLDSLLSLQSSKYKPNLLVSTFGDKLNLKLNKIKVDQKKSLTLELNASAPNLEANFVGEITSDKIITTNVSTLKFSLSQPLVEYFYPAELGYKLKNPANVVIAVDEFSLPYDLKNREFNLLNSMFKGRVDLSLAHLTNQTSLSDIVLKKFSAFITTDESSEDLTLKIDGDASQNDQPIKIALETVLHKSLNFRKHKFPPLKIDLSHIPVAAVDQFFGTGKSLSRVMGAYADLKIEALVQKNHLDLQLKFDSEKFSIPSMMLKIDDDLTMVETPTFKYSLDEAIAKKLLPENSYLSLKRDEPIVVSFHVNPIKNIYEINDLLAENFSGIIKIHHITLNVKETNETVSFQDMVIPWEINLKNQDLNVSFSGNTKHSHLTSKGNFSGVAFLTKEQDTHFFDVQYKQKNAHGHESEVIFKGNIDHLLTKDGALNIYGMGLNLDASMANLPTPLFCKVACLNQDLHKKIEVLFGDFLNANVRLRLNALNGLVQSDVNGEEGSFSINAVLKEGFLFLKDPFQAKFKATERLGKSILHDIFPFLSGVVSSDQPILIAIANDGFVLPIKDFDLSKIEIPEAILSLGHVKFDKSGELATVLSLLTPADTDLISVWFTPLYFKMSEGVLKLERVDMLISNKFPIASWGKIDFVKDKVKMMIGMSGYALTHAFKIKGLDNEYMMQIPFVGTTRSAKIDKVNATTKIGALIAQGQGGPKGLVLGTVLSLAGGALTEEKPPKSTTIPLPWNEELKANQEIADQTPEKPQLTQESEIASELPKEIGKKKNKKFKIDKMLEHQVGEFLNDFLK